VKVTLRQIEAFLAVADELHFGRAAERLHVSPPWLSQTVKDLERALGVELLTRTTRSVGLTEAGAIFASMAGRAVHDLETAVASVVGQGRRSQRAITLGYTIGAGLDVVPGLLRTFAARHPDVPVSTREFDFSDPAAGLREREVDIAVVRPPIGLSGLVSINLFSEPRVACLPEGHPLADRAEVLVDELLGEPIVAAPLSPGPWRDYWILSDYRTSPALVVDEAPTFEAELHLIARGVGISITAMTAARWYRRPGVAFVPIADLDPCHVALAWWPDSTTHVADLVAIASSVSDQADTPTAPVLARSRARVGGQGSGLWRAGGAAPAS
jgi:DNA-binding transcriptional LysR family regulator